MITWQEWCYIIGGYLSGSILYSYLLPKALKGIDITAESPDGNPGTANAFTCAGIPIGILVLCMELLKGYLPVHLALREVNPARWSFALILAAPVFGHACPFLQPQKGGKAIAVSFGVLLGLVPFWLPVLSLAALYLIFSLVIVIDPHFYRSVCTFVLFSVQYFLSGVDDRYQCRLLSDLGCGDPESLRQISGRADECATGTSSVRKRQGISTVMIVC